MFKGIRNFSFFIIFIEEIEKMGSESWFFDFDISDLGDHQIREQCFS